MENHGARTGHGASATQGRREERIDDALARVPQNDCVLQRENTVPPSRQCEYEWPTAILTKRDRLVR